MIDDDVRTDAYIRALSQVITPDSIVVDLGAGSGFFSFEAIRLGARHVHAIEPSDALLVGQRIAKVNGLAESITFHRALSTTVKLPERAHVIVADMRGTLPLLGPVLPAIDDARRRFLRDDGILIPARDVLSCALVAAPKAYDRWTRVYGTRARDLDVRAAQTLLLNRIEGAELDELTPLTVSATLFEIDYARPPPSAHIGEADLVVDETGTAHAIHAWFDATLLEGVRYTTGRAPKGSRAVVYGVTCFPLEEPLELEKGDRVHVRLRANLVDDDVLWSWQVSRIDAAGRVHAGPQQSTFLGRIVDKDTLDRQRADVVPARPKDADIEMWLLTHLGDGRTVDALARALHADFPGRVSSVSDATKRVLRAARRGEE